MTTKNKTALARYMGRKVSSTQVWLPVRKACLTVKSVAASGVGTASPGVLAQTGALSRGDHANENHHEE